MKRLISLRLAVPIILIAIGCSKGQLPTDADAGHVGESNHVADEHGQDIQLSAEAAKIAGIVVEEALMMPIQGELTLPGVVTNASQGIAIVTPPVGGKVIRLLVNVGDKVRAGQAIVELQSSDLAEAAARIMEAERGLTSAEASVREALGELGLSRGELKEAQALLERQKQFASTGAFSQPGVHQAQKELIEAETELAQALQEQVVHQAQLERAERLFRQELISRSELEQARLEAQKDLLRQDKAKRQIEIAKEAFVRERAIAERGLMNSKEIQAVEAEVRSANLRVEQSKIKHRSALSAVRGAQQGIRAAKAGYAALSGGSRSSGGILTVAAPIGGIVTTREATLGQALDRTSEICHIENLRTVWVTASVPEKEIDKAHRGASAQVTVKAFPNRLFPGTVQVIASRLDPNTRTMPVEVLVDNEDAALRAGMFATVTLGVGRSDVVLAVRRSAVVDDGDARSVFVAEGGGKYEEKSVELGRVKGDYVEIIHGLDAGTRVVTKGVFVLKSEKMKGDLKGHDH